MYRSVNSDTLKKLREIAGKLNFQSHRIAHQLDAKGRHELDLPAAFPFTITPFDFHAGRITQRLTWHERLELLVPLDGPLRERMGDLVAELNPGDVLVVDHLKPHQVVDSPELKTRVLVISFLQEWVYTPGCPLTDYAFLLPFFKKDENRPQLLTATSPRAAEAHYALGRLLECYFGRQSFHREAACKAWLLVLLSVLVQEFRDSALGRVKLLRRQEQAARLKPIFDHVRENYADRISLNSAAALCGMSKAVFGRIFKEVSGMTLGSYVNQVRIAQAIKLLEETNETIGEISVQLGFSDQSHFCRHFHRSLGRSPGQYRASLMQKP
ncbi:MAG TPA: AraC family transcriptional regulator [Verrucomicrobiae bacterium]|nr:AraC family transcriptional regulator [Verrucomicrobiae bacterium]